jgi:hypothetical protein
MKAGRSSSVIAFRISPTESSECLLKRALQYLVHLEPREILHGVKNFGYGRSVVQLGEESPQILVHVLIFAHSCQKGAIPTVEKSQRLTYHRP